MTGIETLAAMALGGGLVALGRWMESRSSKSILEAMSAIDSISIRSTESLAAVAQRSAAAINDPSLIEVTRSAILELRAATATVEQRLESISKLAAETREVVLQVAQPDERARMDSLARLLTTDRSVEKPVIPTKSPIGSAQRGVWGANHSTESEE